MTGAEIFANRELIARVIVETSCFNGSVDPNLRHTDEVFAMLRDFVPFVAESQAAAGPELHGEWLTERERDGWRYGPSFDPERKEDPRCVPFETLALPDHLMIGAATRVVRILLAQESY